MSSSNLVRVAFIEETVYGETPGTGNFSTARFTSESLSGTPETTESAQIRVDRLSSGQVVTGLTVGGDLNFELAKEVAIDNILESAMLNDWVVTSAVTVNLELDIALKQLERTTGSFITDGVKVGDIITTTGFVNTANNTQYQVAEIISALIIRVVLAESITFVNETGTGTTYKVADKLEVGINKKSFSMEKSFLDLTDKAINYRGMTVSNLNLNIAYGELISGTASFSGNDYEPVQLAADFMTDGRTINPAATTNSMNGSVDMPWIANSAVGDFDDSTFCIQSVSIELNNNLTTQTCIGKAAPDNYSPGTAAIAVNLSAYLADSNWAIIAKKLSQEPFAVGGLVKNVDGYYGFYMPAVQVSFDDPASGGQNQDVVLDMSGTAKVGANGESSLVLYRS
jgi:hypothetical protein